MMGDGGVVTVMAATRAAGSCRFGAPEMRFVSCDAFSHDSDRTHTVRFPIYSLGTGRRRYV